MHYYQFNIGDYAKSTKHLDPTEDLIYRRLLDLAYDSEKPIDQDIKKTSRLIGLKNNEKETQAILNEFFKSTKNGYIQKRVKKELDRYASKSIAARENGKKGGRPKKTQSVNLANLELTQPKAKQEPITNNHKPSNKGKIFTKPTIEEIKLQMESKNFLNPYHESEKFYNFYESKNWMIGKNKMSKWKSAVANWRSPRLGEGKYDSAIKG